LEKERIALLQLFDLLRKERPEALKKVVAIAGDMSAKGMGLSEESKALLQREVSLVFHGAASVRFDDPLREAILLNTRGTHEIIELSKGMKHLKVSAVPVGYLPCSYNPYMTVRIAHIGLCLEFCANERISARLGDRDILFIVNSLAALGGGLQIRFCAPPDSLRTAEKPRGRVRRVGGGHSIAPKTTSAIAASASP